VIKSHRPPFQLFPPHVIGAAKRFRFDEQLKNDPVEYQKVYEELKIEAALLTIVRISIRLSQSRTRLMPHQNSPYAEVRAVVNNHDDPTMPVSTFRTWFIGMIFVAAGYANRDCIFQTLAHNFDDRLPYRAFINQFFIIRQPGISVSANVAQLLAFPAGKLLEVILPSRQFTTFGHTWSLNPGRFNLKEHMVITIMANAGLAGASIPYVGVLVIFLVYPGRDKRFVDGRKSGPATLLQPGVRFQIRIPEYVTPTHFVLIRVYSSMLFQSSCPSPPPILVTVWPV